MKRLMRTLLIYLKNLTYWLEKEIHKGNKGENTVINTLAPKVLTAEKDVERIKPYLDSLKAAIAAESINNIAITGSYGSGKSTILKTFQDRHKEYEYLNISLASFSENEDAKKKEGKEKEDFERRLEISILQQMFYHVKPEDIPDSRFKRIENLHSWKLFRSAGLLIIWILSALILIKFKYIEKLNPSTWNLSLGFDFVACGAAFIFFLGIAFFIKAIYRLFSNSKINKLNIKGELELGEAIDKSVFNQHLEEILYFFERKKYDVVVIEDVDRFNSTDIFTKLREINILINSSKLINRTVKFVYAIKDEMFSDKNERVKFFEFIIPVISFVNPGNANEQLEKLITDANLREELSTGFTSDIVTFIDDIDMRLLINIFQEYQIYRSVLKLSLNHDKLFAILVYKNIYPDDFGDLAKRKGKLYKFLTSKEEYIKERKKEIDLEIDNLTKEITLLEKEVASNIEELRAVYINKIVAKLENFHSFYFGTNITIEDVVKDQYFDELKTNNTIAYVKYERNYSGNYSISSSRPSKVNLSDVENEVNPTLTYIEREDILAKKAKNAIENLKRERINYIRTKEEIETSSLQEIFINKDITPYLADFDNSYLMRSLLLNGYIDEHYEDYTTLFHGVSITQSDFEFERKVKSGVNLPPDYLLSKTENLIKKLPERYFKREAIRNYYILDCLLENDRKFKTKLDFFYDGLVEDGEKQFQFIYNYIKRKPEKLSLFIRSVCDTKKNFWRYIDSKSVLPAEEIRVLVGLLFEHATKESLYRIEGVGDLDKYIAQIPDFFRFCSTLNQTKTLQAFITERDIKFEHLDLPSAIQNQLFQIIYTKNHYQINEHNIVAVIKGNNIEYNAEEFKKAQYTTIQKLGLKPLQQYISVNIRNYVLNTMTISKGNQDENEKTIIEILNREDVEENVKEKLLESQSTLISRINDITKLETKQLVLSQQSILPNWKNVFAYYDSTESEHFDEHLIEYLNEPGIAELLANDKFKADKSRDEEYFKKISGIVVHCIELELDAYSKLLTCLPYRYNKVDFEKFEIARLRKLLDNNILLLSTENFAGLKKTNSSLSIRLLEQHQTDLLGKFSALPLDQDDWTQIFRSTTINQKNKMQLLVEMDDSIIVNNNSVAEVVCDILPTDKVVTLRYEVVAAMFKANRSVQKRIELLLLHFDNFDDSQIEALITLLGEDYGKIFLKQHKPIFNSKQYNLILFEKLQNRSLIKRYEVDEKKGAVKVIAKYVD